MGVFGIYAIWNPAGVRTSMVQGYAAERPDVSPTVEERKWNPLPRQRDPLPRQFSHERRAEMLQRNVADDNLAYTAYKRSLKEFRITYKEARRESQKQRDGKWTGDRQIVQALSESLHCLDYDTWLSLR